MLELQNRELRVELLDPAADSPRLGTRFCWGGFIWQVHDRASGPLVRGPEWPEPRPSPFNGQGLPESFRHRTLDGKPLTWKDADGVAIGAGALRSDRAGNVLLAAPCSWRIVRDTARVIFTTQHEAAGFSYHLKRAVEIVDRDVHSHTELTNASPHTRLTLEWFAHPFFALVDGEARAELPAGTLLPENPGFALTGRTLTQKRRFTTMSDGHMDRGLRLPRGEPLVAHLAHPSLADVRFQTSFVPDTCVIWGNDRTFSLEPYLTLDLAPGESRSWSLRYSFSASQKT